MGDRRFDMRWADWDAALARGQKRAHMLATLGNVELTELLAASGAAQRAVERNVIATELSNRLRRRSSGTDALVVDTARRIVQAARTLHDTRLLIDEATRGRAERAAQRARASGPRAVDGVPEGEGQVFPSVQS